MYVVRDNGRESLHSIKIKVEAVAETFFLQNGDLLNYYST